MGTKRSISAVRSVSLVYTMKRKISENGMLWSSNQKVTVWWMVKVVRMKVSWYPNDYDKGVVNQEETDEDVGYEQSA